MARLARRPMQALEIDYILSAIPDPDKLVKGTPVTVEQSEIERITAIRSKLGFNTDEPIRFAEVWGTRMVETRDDALRALREITREQLESLEEEIIPSIVESLRNNLIRTLDRARIDPGTPVGVRAAEALGGPIQQMVLNTFHTSGSAANTSGGVSAFSELLNLSTVRKSYSTTVHFWKKPTYVEALRKESDIIELHIMKMVKSNDMIPTEGFEPEWWYDAYTESMGVVVPETAWALRLTFDVDLLYRNSLFLSDVVKHIENLGVVRCVASPTDIGIIDVYSIPAAITELRSKKKKKAVAEDAEEDDSPAVQSSDAATIFPESEVSDEGAQASAVLLNIVIPRLQDTIIKGCKGIRAAVPVLRPVWSIVRSEKYDEKKKNWTIQINTPRSQHRAIYPSELHKLLTSTGIEVLSTDGEFFTVHNTVNPSQRPGETVNKRISSERDAYQKAIAVRDENEKGIPRERFPIIDYASNIVLETDGGNLRALYRLTEIDYRHTISNSAHEINDIFGIGAARNFLMQEFFFRIDSARSYVQPRHVVLLVDYMTCTGKLLSTSFFGLQKRTVSTFTIATHQRALDTIANAAVTGRKEAVRGASAQILTNRRGDYGTGSGETITPSEIAAGIEEASLRKETEEEHAAAVREQARLSQLYFGGTTRSSEVRSRGIRQLLNEFVGEAEMEDDTEVYDADLIFGADLDDESNDAIMSMATPAPTVSARVGRSDEIVLAPPPTLYAKPVADPKMKEIGETLVISAEPVVDEPIALNEPAKPARRPRTAPARKAPAEEPETAVKEAPKKRTRLAPLGKITLEATSIVDVLGQARPDVNEIYKAKH